VVLAVGLSATDPVPEVEAKFPGAMVTLVAPVVLQLSVVLAPLVIDAGLAAKEAMVGVGSCLVVGIGAVHPANPHAASNSPNSQFSLWRKGTNSTVPHPRRAFVFAAGVGTAQTAGPGTLRQPQLSFPTPIR
jgi:hypothetical protein